MAMNQLPMPMQVGQMGQQGDQGNWLSALLSFLIGNKGRMQQYSTITPQQAQTSDFLRQFGQNRINNPYQGFEPIANKLNNQWSQNVVPSLAARFSGLGDNKTTSGAFTSQLQGSNNQLQDIIGSLMAQFGQQSTQQGLGALGQSMAPQFENVYHPSSQGLLQNLWNAGQQAVSGSAGTAAKAFTGGF